MSHIPHVRGAKPSFLGTLAPNTRGRTTTEPLFLHALDTTAPNSLGALVPYPDKGHSLDSVGTPAPNRKPSRLPPDEGGGASHCSGVREEEARASGPSPWYCDYDCRRSLHRGPTGLDSAAQTGEEAQPRPVSGPVPYPQGSGGLPPRTAAVRAELALLVEGTYQLSPTKEDSPSAPNDAQITKARLTAFVDELPRSGAGKKNRKTERPIAEGRGAISLAVV